MKTYHQIEEQLKLNNTATDELHMGEFAYYTYAPKVGDKYTTPSGTRVVTIESEYYHSANLCILRFRMVWGEYIC